MVLSFFFFKSHCMACRILVPQPGTEPMSPALGALILNHWTASKVKLKFVWPGFVFKLGFYFDRIKTWIFVGFNSVRISLRPYIISEYVFCIISFDPSLQVWINAHSQTIMTFKCSSLKFLLLIVKQNYLVWGDMRCRPPYISAGLLWGSLGMIVENVFQECKQTSFLPKSLADSDLMVTTPHTHSSSVSLHCPDLGVISRDSAVYSFINNALAQKRQAGGLWPGVFIVHTSSLVESVGSCGPDPFPSWWGKKWVSVCFPSAERGALRQDLCGGLGVSLLIF